MISRSDWEPLPKPTLSPFARGYLSLCRFFTAAVWCVPALRVPLVHSLINHFRQKNYFGGEMYTGRSTARYVGPGRSMCWARASASWAAASELRRARVTDCVRRIATPTM